MTKFVVNRAVITRRPAIRVNAGLKQGTHRFKLVVIDSQGNKSKPAFVTIKITGRNIRFFNLNGVLR